MRFTAAVFAAAGLTGAVAQNATASDVYTTEIVTAFTTYCPEATKITIGGSTHTVSEATTLTITSCPGGCTITHPVSYSSSPVAPMSYSSSPAEYTTSSSVVAPMSYSSSSMMSSSPVAPVYTSSMTSVPYPSTNGTSSTPCPSGTVGTTATGPATSTGSPIATQTGNSASRGYSAAGAGLLAVFGLVAAL